jgi:hypothetical protein
MKTKRNVILILALLALALRPVLAQTPAEVLAHGTTVTFFGIDFSACRGIVLGAGAEEMRDVYFPAINELMLAEEEKYSIRKAFMKSDVTNTLSDVTRVNKTLDAAGFAAYSASEVKPLDAEALSAMISKYELKDRTGVGLVFIAEYLDKPKTKGVFHVVYFSMPDGRIILSEKVSGKPGGFGMRNFWARSVFEVLNMPGDGVKTFGGIQSMLEQKYVPAVKKK